MKPILSLFKDRNHKCISCGKPVFKDRETNNCSCSIKRFYPYSNICSEEESNRHKVVRDRILKTILEFPRIEGREYRGIVKEEVFFRKLEDAGVHHNYVEDYIVNEQKAIEEGHWVFQRTKDGILINIEVEFEYPFISPAAQKK